MDTNHFGHKVVVLAAQHAPSVAIQTFASDKEDPSPCRVGVPPRGMILNDGPGSRSPQPHGLAAVHRHQVEPRLAVQYSGLVRSSASPLRSMPG